MQLGSENPFLHKPYATFWQLFVGYLIVLLPILRANGYQLDDIPRSYTGQYGWAADGRPLAELLMRVLQFNAAEEVDISPLPQILAIAILSIAGALLARRFAIDSPWVGALVTFPLGAQPFFLENLSFRFDAAGMALAVLLAVLPIVIWPRGWRSWWGGVASLLLCLCAYQPAINVFIAFACLECRFEQSNDRPIRFLLRRGVARAGQLIFVAAIYRVVFMNHLSSWATKHSRLPSAADQFSILLENERDAYEFIRTAFGARWETTVAPLLLAALMFSWLAGWVHLARRRRDEPASCCLLTAILIGILPFAALGSVIGPMAFISGMLIDPRVLVGVGGLLSASLIALHLALREWKVSDRPMLLGGGLLALAMLIFAQVFGNAAAEQVRSDEQVLSRVVQDLEAVNRENDLRFFIVTGSGGFSPLNQRVIQRFPLIAMLIKMHLADFPGTELVLRSQDFLPPAYSIGYGKVRAVLAQLCSTPMPSSLRRDRYEMTVVGDTVVVTFLTRNKARCTSTDLRPGSGTPIVPDGRFD